MTGTQHPDFTRANRDPALRGRDRAVLWECRLRLAPDAWGTLADWHIAATLHMATPDVRRALRRLTDAGYLDRSTRQRDGYRYRIADRPARSRAA